MNVQVIINWKSILAFGGATGLIILAAKTKPEQVKDVLNTMAGSIKSSLAISE